MTTPPRLTIAIDCDDVIVATAPALVAMYRDHYGVEVDMKDFYATTWGTDDRATTQGRTTELLKSTAFQQLPPFQEAIEAIRLLKQHHDLHIVTGRSDFLANATHQMLEQYFPETFQSVEFTNFFSDTPRPKSAVCQALGADLLIDDHLHHAEIVAACGIEVLLFGDYPWNHADSLPPSVTRVAGWSEVVARLT